MGEGLFSRIKTMIGVEEEEYEEEVEMAPAVQSRPQPLAVNEPRRPVYPDRSPSTFVQPKVDHRESSSKVVSMQNSTTTSTAVARAQQLKLVVIDPKSFDESPKLVDSLKSKKPVILNLESIDTETARKIFDFMSGATYALNGKVQRVSNNIFIFAPENVDVLSELESSPGTGKTGSSFGSSLWRR